MLYKTIVLELLQERPDYYEQLRSSKRLLPSMDTYANELKAMHEIWMERLDQEQPGSNKSQIAAEALELAVLGIQDSLPSVSANLDVEPGTLDAAMSFIRRHTPPA